MCECTTVGGKKFLDTSRIWPRTVFSKESQVSKRSLFQLQSHTELHTAAKWRPLQHRVSLSHSWGSKIKKLSLCFSFCWLHACIYMHLYASICLFCFSFLFASIWCLMYVWVSAHLMKFWAGLAGNSESIWDLWLQFEIWPPDYELFDLLINTDKLLKQSTLIWTNVQKVQSWSTIM